MLSESSLTESACESNLNLNLVVLKVLRNLKPVALRELTSKSLSGMNVRVSALDKCKGAES